jgi:hypothetical protein
MKRILRVIFFIVITVSAVSTQAKAAWWEMSSLPVPQDTREINREKRTMMGEEFDYIYYESVLSSAAVRDFYQRRLSVLGWELQNPAGVLNKLRDSVKGSELTLVTGTNQTYRKGDDMIVLGLLPDSVFKGGKMRYLLAKGKMAKSDREKDLNDVDYFPRLASVPQKDPVCVYPGAMLSDYNVMRNSSQATYFAKDDIARIVEFYKTAMPSSYAWSLADETPLQASEIQVDPQTIAKQCPNCPDEIKSMNPEISSERAALLFSSANGDTCQITFTQMRAKEEKYDAFGGITIILVHYAKQNK